MTASESWSATVTGLCRPWWSPRRRRRNGPSAPGPRPAPRSGGLLRAISKSVDGMVPAALVAFCMAWPTPVGDVPAAPRGVDTKKQYLLPSPIGFAWQPCREACIKSQRMRKRSCWLASRSAHFGRRLGRINAKHRASLDDRARPAHRSRTRRPDLQQDLPRPDRSGRQHQQRPGDPRRGGRRPVAQLCPRCHPQRHRDGLGAPAVRPLRLRRHRFGRRQDRPRHRRKA